MAGILPSGASVTAFLHAPFTAFGFFFPLALLFLWHWCLLLMWKNITQSTTLFGSMKQTFSLLTWHMYRQTARSKHTANGTVIKYAFLLLSFLFFTSPLPPCSPFQLITYLTSPHPLTLTSPINPYLIHQPSPHPSTQPIHNDLLYHSIPDRCQFQPFSHFSPLTQSIACWLAYMPSNGTKTLSLYSLYQSQASNLLTCSLRAALPCHDGRNK